MEFRIVNGTAVFPEGISELPMAAFSSCEELTDVIIPDSVTAIGAGAFRECSNLVSVFIP
ncbi:MAG: leucine-rich repeat protein [Lachnospiraceae bacterium]|nr:leucine-rich repeat protein [Lachnospiraceae bacterium]